MGGVLRFAAGLTACFLAGFLGATFLGGFLVVMPFKFSGFTTLPEVLSRVGALNDLEAPLERSMLLPNKTTKIMPNTANISPKKKNKGLGGIENPRYIK